jgi:diguanylate cyclase (GGDEF)-like protein/PAS domain S-box-containing protein
MSNTQFEGLESKLGFRGYGLCYREGIAMPISEKEFADYQAILLEVAKSKTLDAGDLSAACRLVLEAACDGLGIVRASFWRLDRQQPSIQCQMLLDTRKGLIEDTVVLREQDIPAYFDAICQERSVVAPDVVNDPKTKELAEEYLIPLGITSLLDSPVMSRGDMMGIVCCEHVGEPRQWSLPQQMFVTSLADLMGRAVTAHDRNRAEAAMRLSEERFQGAFEQSVTPMLLMSQTGYFEQVNQAFCDLLEESSTRLHGKCWLDFVHSDDRQKSIDAVAPLLESDAADVDYRCRLKKASGDTVWVSVHCSEIQVHDKTQPYHMAVIQDITENYQLSLELAHQAIHDPLTGLINRAEFRRLLEATLEAVRDEETPHAFCYLDLDQFKVVNVTSGHEAGDELLRQLSGLLVDAVGSTGTVARLGGDECGVLLQGYDQRKAAGVARDILQRLRAHAFRWAERSFEASASLGLVMLSPLTASVGELFQQADIACFAAKEEGRNRMHIYEADDQLLARRRGEIDWVSRINKTMKDGRFCLYAQPIVPLKKGDDSFHLEILLRMIDESGNIISPGVFLAAAERYNLMPKVDRWVVKAALSAIREGEPALARASVVSINLSGASLADDSFLDFIIEQFQQQGVAPQKICFEITETAAIGNFTAAKHFIQTLRALGCRFALDDFGSGLSSFAYLRALDVDILKIDGLFVKDIDSDPVDRGIVKTIHELCHLIGKKTIAEFVESRAILAILREIGVDYIQGYAIGAPSPLATALPLTESLQVLDQA